MANKLAENEPGAAVEAVAAVKNTMLDMALAVRTAVRRLHAAGAGNDDLSRRLRSVLSAWYDQADELDAIEDEALSRSRVRQ